MGRYHVQICTNVSCMLRGGVKLLQHAKQRLDIGQNEATADRKFSLEEVECMGACSGAPLVVINETYYEHVTESQLDELLNRCD